MAKNHTTAYDPRQIWATNLAPLVTAARAGAAHAADTASKERARARAESRWWRSRWLVVATAGLAVAGAAGSAYAVARKRSRSGQTADAAPASQESDGALKSKMDAGRDRVTGVARSVRDRFRSGEPAHDEPAPDGRTEQASPVAF